MNTHKREFLDLPAVRPAKATRGGYQYQVSEHAAAQHLPTATAPFWMGDWRLGMAEERVAMAEEQLARAEARLAQERESGASQNR